MREKITVEAPALMLEWDYEKNKALSPENFTGGSDQKVWWKCKRGHSWLAAIKNRIIGNNCPYCAGKKAWAGYNDLPTVNPMLAKEWDYGKNNGLRPRNFTASSNKYAWWICALGHSWFAMVNNRNKGQNCPYCAGVKALTGFNDLSTTSPRIAKEWNYDQNNGLCPEQFTKGSNEKVWWKCAHGHSWKAAISSRERHGCPHCYGNILSPGINDLLTMNPKVAAEWDYDKNDTLRPENVAANASTKVWWHCGKGHKWNASIRNRNNGNGCPYCANRFALKGFNDLMTIAPELCGEWDYARNAPLLPDEVTSNTSRSVWWKCAAKGHVWKAAIVHRRRGSGCPYCAGKAVLAGDNDLKTLRPDIADEWDYEKNAPLTPDRVPAQSTKKVWWRCQKRGHSYSSVIYNRFYGNGCPYCAGNLPIVGETDLATIYPEFLEEWDYERNGENKPENYTCGSNKKVYWKCKRGHRWRAPICERTTGTKCPRCNGKTQMRTRLVK